MSIIYKYTIPNVPGYVGVPMRVGAKILTAQLQGNDICIWAMVNPNAGSEIRGIMVQGTGVPIEADIEDDLKYIGTVQMEKNEWVKFDIVAHVFEVLLRRDGTGELVYTL